MHRPHYICGMPSVVHICNTCTLYINQSTSDQTPKYTLWTPNIPAKTNKSAKYAQHSSVWHVEYALKYGQIHFEQGTTCWNMLKCTICTTDGCGTMKCTLNNVQIWVKTPNWQTVVKSVARTDPGRRKVGLWNQHLGDVQCIIRSIGAQMHSKTRLGQGRALAKCTLQNWPKYGLDRKLYWNCKYDQIYTICNVAHCREMCCPQMV